MRSAPRCGVANAEAFSRSLAVITPLVRLLRSALVVLVAASIGAEAADAWRSVRGAELRALFVDHELADGVHYAYRFRSDGKFSGFNMVKQVSGAWRASGDEFCWTLARRAAEECFQIELRGRSVRLLRDGYEAFSATVTPVNAQSRETR